MASPFFFFHACDTEAVSAQEAFAAVRAGGGPLEAKSQAIDLARALDEKGARAIADDMIAGDAVLGASGVVGCVRCAPLNWRKDSKGKVSEIKRARDPKGRLKAPPAGMGFLFFGLAE